MNGAPGRREILARLNSTGFSPQALRRILEGLEPEAILEAPAEALAKAGDVALEDAARLKDQARAFDAAREFERAGRLGIALIAFDEPDYPALLRQVPDGPILLYVRGRLSDEARTLAFVGSRRPTPYGRRMARSLAGQAAASGAVVVSGLARGIDAEAHLAAMEAGGKTWAVLGSGLERLYPPENEGLARKILSAGGCLISEFPLDCPPLPGHFPRRNRIVSGLSWGTIVVEGARGSGALITARLAGEQGREVFAVPGPADSPLSEAPHRLLREGAKLVCGMEDVWEALPAGLRPLKPAGGGAAGGEGAARLSMEQRKILQLMGADSVTIEELGQATGIDLPRLSNILFEMELQDMVGPLPGQRYAKKRS